MNNNYIVYTEKLNGTPNPERWYYGTYSRERANEVALDLDHEYPYFHCVCKEEDAEKLGVQGLDDWW